MKEWRTDGTTLTKPMINDLIMPWSLFVTTDGTIYSDTGILTHNVKKWLFNETEGTVVMDIGTGFCVELFVDIINNVYCSLSTEHKIIKTLFDASENTSNVVITGKGSCGSDLDMLCAPAGIFVTTEFDLYVADYANHRIQLFESGQLTGETVMGDIKTLSIRLNCPISVIVDADGYLFVVDFNNNRIIRSNSNGFYCVVGCSGVAGTASDQLNQPFTAAFDSLGNIFVLDAGNHRFQKFTLMTNTDSK